MSLGKKKKSQNNRPRTNSYQQTANHTPVKETVKIILPLSAASKGMNFFTSTDFRSRKKKKRQKELKSLGTNKTLSIYDPEIMEKFKKKLGVRGDGSAFGKKKNIFLLAYLEISIIPSPILFYLR